jgi:hypothetical protein
VIAHRLSRDAALNWRAYRAWHRACLLNAGRATRHHFGRGWRSVVEVLAPGGAAILALCVAGDVRSAGDSIAVIALGGAVSALWVIGVSCWNFGLAPYRLWRAARERIAHLQVAVGRRIDRQVITEELELRIREGVALMNSGSPSQSQLTEWYERVLRAVSRAGDRERTLLESSGPAPGTRGGALEMLILSNRIEKLRLILERQKSARAARRRRPQAAASPNLSIREALAPTPLRRVRT